MLIDWPTVAAQVVNFLILLWLLKKFLYRPIVSAMDEREARIARRLRDSEERSAEALEKDRSLARELSEIEARRSEILAQAREEAERLRQELAASARSEVEEARKGWLESLKRERAIFLKELSLQAGHGTLAVARRVLHDLSGVDLQERVAEMVLNRLKEDTVVREELRASFANSSAPVVVLTACDISPESRGELEQFLLDELGSSAEIQFDVDPKMIFGLRIKLGGREIGLDVPGYLDELERDLSRAIEAELEESIESR